MKMTHLSLKVPILFYSSILSQISVDILFLIFRYTVPYHRVNELSQESANTILLAREIGWKQQNLKETTH